MILYGIPNCNTVKKAKDWLLQHTMEFDFYDFKKKGITVEKLSVWCEAFGWEKVLNKQGTTWKKQSHEEQLKIIDEPSAIEFLLKNTSAIKRPVLEVSPGKILLGFDESAYQSI
jgi:arsenate reductase